MQYSSLPTFRILAIDPCSQGFGYAVLEEPSRLVDWGVKNSLRKVGRPRLRRGPSCLVRSFTRLLDDYQPSIIVIRDRDDAPVRHRRRMEQLRRLAEERRIEVQVVSWNDVRALFQTCGVKTKEEIAAAIARRFPELLPAPRHRRPWMSEDYRMNIFDAVALALVVEPIPGSRPAIRSP